MAESVYKIIELVGTSTESWEKAAAAAVALASQSLRELRIAEVSELDLQIENGAVTREVDTMLGECVFPIRTARGQGHLCQEIKRVAHAGIVCHIVEGFSAGI